MGTKRLVILAIIAVLVATVFGAGVTRSQAQAPTSPAAQVQQPSAQEVDDITKAEVKGPDTDNVQDEVGDQNESDDAAEVEEVGAGPDTDNVQEGDQQGVDTEAEAGESQTADDGPGGHSDEPDDPNADHQFEGEE